MLEEGKRHRERTGKSLMVPRYDIVPIPERLRRNMSAGSIIEFHAETPQRMDDSRADDQVGNISPRPLLLLHSANDSVTPTYESIEMFRRAGQPAELHLLSDVDHFTFNEENPRLTRIVSEWLARYFPVQKQVRGSVSRKLSGRPPVVAQNGQARGLAHTIAALSKSNWTAIRNNLVEGLFRAQTRSQRTTKL